jgi:3-oxoacyl-[acyl-carrier protein] reductase
MDLELEGRTVLVTGASKGIGRATALRFAQAGANLVVCARGEDALTQVRDEIAAVGAHVEAVVCDVADHAAADVVLERARARFRGIDVLVNNAGVPLPGELLTTTDADWEQGFEVNFFSAVRFTRACLPWMVEQGWGRIINLSSTTAKLADVPYPIYGSTKAALLSFSKTVAAAYSKHGICCNAVLPGIVLTPAVEFNIETVIREQGMTRDEVLKKMMGRWPVPSRRFGEPEEIADAIVFLASARAGWITGASLPIDGGTIPVVG